VPQAGARYPFTVAIPSTCSWTATTDVSWADVAPGSGQGDKALVLTIGENPARDPRTVTVTVNGQSVRVVQVGVACSYAINPSSLNLSGDSTGGTITLTTAPGCPWTATSSESWIRLLPTSGSGSVVLALDISPHVGAERRAVLTIAGLRVDVTQEAR
jgi:hypothetical protein